MLVAATVFTTQRQRLVQRWKLEGGIPPVPGQKTDSPNSSTAPVAEAAPAAAPPIPLHWRKEDFILLPEHVIGPVTTVENPDYAGLFAIYDWDTKEVIWTKQWGGTLLNPAGYCFADGVMYLADLEGANLYIVDVDGEPGKLLKRISHPYLNDVHSLERTKRGLMVTNSGNDTILELDLDGNLLWEWWASEHGYDTSPSGNKRTPGRGLEHRDQYYHTRYQATHINVAVMQDESERYVLAFLFHQGQMVRIDRSLPEAEQNAEVLLEGLARPHGLEKFPGGWTFCNSLAKEMVVLDDDLKITGTIPYDGGWIQDSTRLSNGNILLNDVDKSVLVEFAGTPYRPIGTTSYDPNWRMAELVEVPKEHEAAYRRAAEAEAKAAV